MKAVKRRSECPISYSLDFFGDKWSLLILRDIIFYNRRRYSDFAPHEHIASNILADRLEKLEAAGFISKSPDPVHGKQFVYEATEKGMCLLPILTELMLWGFESDPQSLVSKEFLARCKADKQTVVEEMSRAIKDKKFSMYRTEQMGISADKVGA